MNKNIQAGYQVKSGEATPPSESKVAEEVLAQIKSFGEDSKKNYEELRKNYEELRKTVDEGKNDAVTEAKLAKLTEDISTRQAAIDEMVKKQGEEFTRRTDELEIALKRPGISGGNSDEFEREVRSFALSVEAAKGSGIKSNSKEFEKYTAEKVKEYKRNFDTFLRYGEKTMELQEQKSMLVGSDPDGGYVVTPVMASSILARMYELDPMRQLASVETISTGAVEWLVDWDETDAEWEEETVAVEEDTKTAQLNKKRISVYPLAARPKATQTLIEDASINIESWLSKKAADKFNRKEATSFITGDGVGKPRGFLTYDNYASAGVDQYGKVEQINMGAAAALTADGFISVKYSLIEQFLGRGTWLMNRSTVAAAMKLKTGAGEYVWKPGLTADSQATILDLPVRMSTTMPIVGANALSVALADWKEAYMIVDRLGITVQRDPYTKKPYIEFYFRKRTGGDVVNYQAIKIGKIAV